MVLGCHGKTVAGDMAEVGGMFKETAHAAGSQYDGFCLNLSQLAVPVFYNDSAAAVSFHDQIHHQRIFLDGDILFLSCRIDQLAGDLLAGHVFMVQDAAGAVGSFSGVVKAAVFTAVEFHSVGDQPAVDFRCPLDHALNGFFVVFISPRPEGVFKEGFKILLFF